MDNIYVMSQILGIKFTDYGQIYSFSSGAFVVEKEACVIVKTEQGMGLGQVVTVSSEDESADHDHNTIYRLANEQDMETREENLKLAREAFRNCRSCIESHGLEMKLVDVEIFFDRSKMIFYFTAPGRIDFRELIKDLVREYRTRIELRQIGVRHETQMLGAIGNCGQLCCCRRFMRKFVPVTIKMAKEQNLFLNPTKISGICGRLLCCLSFEQQGYEEFNRMCPKVGKRYQSSEGMVKIIRANFFRKSLTAVFEDGSSCEIPVDEWSDFVKKVPSEDKRESLDTRSADARSADTRSGNARFQQRRDVQQKGTDKASGREDRSQESERSAKPNDSRENSSVQNVVAQDSGKEQKRPRRRRRRPRKKN